MTWLNSHLRLLLAQPWSWLGALVIALVVGLTFAPATSMGFWTDDYLHIDMVGRADGCEFLARILDPRRQIFWYRPLVGLQWKLEYILWGGNAGGFHFVQIAYHGINAILLAALTTRLTRRRRAGWIAGLVFGTLALPSQTVYWTAVHDPLATIFALGAFWWWLDYLTTEPRHKMLLAWVAFAGAVLSKEIAAVLPALLFLADRLLIARPATLNILIKRYLPFGVLLLFYAPLYWIVATQSVFTQRIGYGVSEQMLTVLGYFLSWIALPWDVGTWTRYVALPLGFGALVILALKHDRRWWFLLAAGALPTLILAPIPAHLTNPRYLYLPLTATAAGYGLLFDRLLSTLENARWRWAQIGIKLGLVALVVAGSLTIYERIENQAGFTRQMRQSFRTIYQAHPTLPPRTQLYFLDMPIQTLDISGIMFLRYGNHVAVNGIDQPHGADFAPYTTNLIYYYDENHQFREQVVAASNTAISTPVLPAHFEQGITLTKAQIVPNPVPAGDALIVLLEWLPAQRIPQDFTVFAHLVDADGHQVAGEDSQPQRGRAPTTTWRAKQLVLDALVLPVAKELAAGKYTLHVGLYDLKTMRRLALLDSQGQPIGDTVAFTPIQVSER